MKNETTKRVNNIIMSDTNTIKRVNFWSTAVYEIVSHNFKSGAYYEIVDEERKTVINDIHSERDAQRHLRDIAIHPDTPIKANGGYGGKTFEQLPQDLQAEIYRMATV